MKLLQDMATDAGEFLRRLDCESHSEDEAKTLIKALPSALSHIGDKGCLPIHSAMRTLRSTPFISRYLLKKVTTLDIGGTGQQRNKKTVKHINSLLRVHSILYAVYSCNFQL